MFPISPATPDDIPQIVRLLNGAYRGEASKEGWTTEADLLLGALRTDEANLASLMANENAVFLKYAGEDGQILGCVFLENQAGRLYLGMLSVHPRLQAQGIGKRLLAAAEDHARAQNCSTIFMRVFNVRTELIAWYFRHGYRDTGELIPFNGDPRFGAPVRPLEFAILEKRIF